MIVWIGDGAMVLGWNGMGQGSLPRNYNFTGGLDKIWRRLAQGPRNSACSFRHD